MIEGFLVLSWCSGWLIWNWICFTQRKGFRFGILVSYLMRFATNGPMKWVYFFKHTWCRNHGSLIEWRAFVHPLTKSHCHVLLFCTVSLASSAVCSGTTLQLFYHFCSSKLFSGQYIPPACMTWSGSIMHWHDTGNIWRMMGMLCGRGWLLICTYVSKFSVFVKWAPWIFN